MSKKKPSKSKPSVTPVRYYPKSDQLRNKLFAEAAKKGLSASAYINLILSEKLNG